MRWLLLALMGCTVGSDESASEFVDSEVEDLGDSDSAEMFRVFSLNLHCFRPDGSNYSSNEERFSVVASKVLTEEVDVVLLQEVCERDGENSAEWIHDLLNAQDDDSWTWTWEPTHLAWEGTGDEAMEGLAVLSRVPIDGSERVEHFVQGSLLRAAQWVTFPSGLRIVNVHLDHEQDEIQSAQGRHAASAALATRGESLDAMVMGDFNSVAGQGAAAAVEALGFVNAAPELSHGSVIDHAFLHRGAAWQAVEAQWWFDGGPSPRVSDHPGLFVQVERVQAIELLPSVIEITVELKNEQWVNVRGDGTSMSWDWGLPAIQQPTNEWLLVLTEPNADFEFKVLRDDLDWQIGENQFGVFGQVSQVSPEF